MVDSRDLAQCSSVVDRPAWGNAPAPPLWRGRAVRRRGNSIFHAVRYRQTGAWGVVPAWPWIARTRGVLRRRRRREREGRAEGGHWGRRRGWGVSHHKYPSESKLRTFCFRPGLDLLGAEPQSPHGSIAVRRRRRQRRRETGRARAGQTKSVTHDAAPNPSFEEFAHICPISSRGASVDCDLGWSKLQMYRRW